MLQLSEGVDDGGEVFGEELLVDLVGDGEAETTVDGDFAKLIH